MKSEQIFYFFYFHLQPKYTAQDAKTVKYSHQIKKQPYRMNGVRVLTVCVSAKRAGR